jgi:hypothetical protein
LGGESRRGRALAEPRSGNHSARATRSLGSPAVRAERAQQHFFARRNRDGLRSRAIFLRPSRRQAFAERGSLWGARARRPHRDRNPQRSKTHASLPAAPWTARWFAASGATAGRVRRAAGIHRRRSFAAGTSDGDTSPCRLQPMLSNRVCGTATAGESCASSIATPQPANQRPDDAGSIRSVRSITRRSFARCRRAFISTYAIAFRTSRRPPQEAGLRRSRGKLRRGAGHRSQCDTSERRIRSHRIRPMI